MSYTDSSGFTISHNGSREGAAFFSRMVALDRQYRRNSIVCAGWLRSLGIRLAHPDDGWVDRLADTLTPVYPLFSDHPSIGDKIALGSPSHETSVIGTFRIVLVQTEHRTLYGGRRYGFVKTSDTIQVPGDAVVYFDPVRSCWASSRDAP